LRAPASLCQLRHPCPVVRQARCISWRCVCRRRKSLAARRSSGRHIRLLLLRQLHVGLSVRAQPLGSNSSRSAGGRGSPLDPLPPAWIHQRLHRAAWARSVRAGRDLPSRQRQQSSRERLLSRGGARRQMNTEPICPCEDFEHPIAWTNQAGLRHVRYRAGDFRTFRRALLRSLPGESELTGWRPNSQGDLLLQILEWWAYVADVLSFYNERSINERLLATAMLDANVRGLVEILGYRPRPGIGGNVSLGVLLSGTRPMQLPAGFRVQSKPAPGKQPQTFETTEAYVLAPPDFVRVEPQGTLIGVNGQLYLAGTVKSIQPGELLLLVSASGEQESLIEVQQVNHGEDSIGKPYTEIVPAVNPA